MHQSLGAKSLGGVFGVRGDLLEMGVNGSKVILGF